MRMRNLRDVSSILPNNFPTLAIVRNSGRRSKIHAKDFVLDQNETDFTHGSNISKHVQLSGFYCFAHGRWEARKIQLLIRAAQTNSGVHDLQRFGVDDALEATTAQAIPHNGLHLSIASPIDQLSSSMGQREADSALQGLLPPRQFDGPLLEFDFLSGATFRFAGQSPLGGFKQERVGQRGRIALIPSRPAV